MKLLGSKTEQDFRDVLSKSHHDLFDRGMYPRLHSLLKSSYKDMKTAYFLNHIPEQGEDLYTMLINQDIIAYVEISKSNDVDPAITKSCGVDEFVIGLSKVLQIKLAVAMELAKHDVQKNGLAKT